MRTRIRELFRNTAEHASEEVTVCAWVRTNRAQSQFGFLNINDGSFFENLQVVYEQNLPNFESISKIGVGASVKVVGTVVLTPEHKQPFEVKAKSVELLGDCPEDYPIQPKRHTREYLRTVAHLRPRTNLFSAVFRIRSVAAMAIHSYFQERGYLYVHTPLITCADCEGSDQMFKITTLIAMAFGDIYTFGPTFRTENSNTQTHANEFWMIEPEMAFCDLEGLMDIEEEMLKYIVKYVCERCPEEINFCDSFVSKGLKDKLNDIMNAKFTRIKHHDVIDILKKADVKWEFEPDYGEDIAKEHEKYIVEYFNGPVFVTDWPKDIKAYYMKVNPDNKTVAAVDLLVPQAGELMGGSQREENLDKLIERMDEMGVDKSGIDWYLDTRRYGGCIHSGFGMGFERLIMYLTGVENIRDVIPYPRTPRTCDF